MVSLDSHIEALDSSISRDFEPRSRFRSLDLCIGGWPSRLWVDSERLLDEAAEKYAAFLSTESPVFQMIVTETEFGEQEQFAQTIESASVDSRHYIFRWDFGIRVDLAANVTHAHLHYGSGGSLDSILRISHALYAVMHQGVLFHSASIRLGDRAIALVGGTGCGKSALSERLGVTVFSDELTVIRERDDGMWLYGTPFHGQFAEFTNDQAPVSMIVALRETDADPPVDGPTAAIRFLMKHAFFFGDATSTSELLLTHITRIVQGVPVRSFLLDESLRSKEGSQLREVILELSQS